jgi:tripartite motif-containing protein 71
MPTLPAPAPPQDPAAGRPAPVGRLLAADGALLLAGELRAPCGVAIDSAGRIAIADYGNNRVVLLGPDGRIAATLPPSGGGGGGCGGGGGPGGEELDGPVGVGWDPAGRVVVSYQRSHRLGVWRADGALAAVWPPGPAAAAAGPARLNTPKGLAVDWAGRVLVADSGNHRVAVFGPDGGWVGALGEEGSGPGQLRHPKGVAVDGGGRVLVADNHNHRVAVFGPDGAWAGALGGFGDGPGRLKHPIDVAVTRAGPGPGVGPGEPGAGGERVVVADHANSRLAVFGPGGEWAGSFGREGRGGGAGRLLHPTGVACDSDGRVVVAEFGNHRLQVARI